MRTGYGITWYFCKNIYLTTKFDRKRIIKATPSLALFLWIRPECLHNYHTETGFEPTVWNPFPITHNSVGVNFLTRLPIRSFFSEPLLLVLISRRDSNWFPLDTFLFRIDRNKNGFGHELLRICHPVGFSFPFQLPESRENVIFYHFVNRSRLLKCMSIPRL